MSVKDGRTFGDETDGLKTLGGITDALTSLVSHERGPSSILVDGGWGSGKTDFSLRWQNSLVGHQVVRFDAFEADITDDAFAALVASISSQLRQGDRKKLVDAASSVAASILKNLPKTIARGAAHVVIGDKAGAEVEKAIADGLGSSAESLFAESVDLLTTRRSAIEKLGACFEEISQQSDGKPVILIVDELDRCRPNFALEVLDIIHHILDFQHLRTITFANSHAIAQQAFPTSKDLGQQYLEKFFDFYLNLPRGEEEIDPRVSIGFDSIVRYFVKKYDLPQENHIQIKVVKAVAVATRSNYRAVEHSLKHISYFSDNDHDMSVVAAINILIALKYMRPDIYDGIGKKYKTFSQVVAELGGEEVFSEVDRHLKHFYASDALMAYRQPTDEQFLLKLLREAELGSVAG